jgi:hypothetical protein
MKYVPVELANGELKRLVRQREIIITGEVFSPLESFSRTRE